MELFFSNCNSFSSNAFSNDLNFSKEASLSNWTRTWFFSTLSPDSTSISSITPPIGIWMSLTSPFGSNLPNAITTSSVLAKPNHIMANDDVPTSVQVTDFNQKLLCFKSDSSRDNLLKLFSILSCALLKYTLALYA